MTFWKLGNPLSLAILLDKATINHFYVQYLLRRLTRNLILDWLKIVSYKGTNFYHAQQTLGINSMTESQEINRSKTKEKNRFSQEI